MMDFANYSSPLLAPDPRRVNRKKPKPEPQSKCRWSYPCLRADPDFAQFRDQIRSPTVGVELPDDLTHTAHPRTLLVRIHFQCEVNGVGQLLRIIRIDQQRVAQFAARTGEPAQDQDALFVVPRCNKLLGDEVHAVVKRRDQAQVRRPVISPNLAMRVVALEEDDRLPASRLESPVDAVGLGFNFPEQVMVAFDVSPAGLTYLDEGEMALVSGIFLQKSFYSAKALQHSLGIVHPVNTHAEEGALHTLLSKQCSSFKIRRALALTVRLPHFREGNANGKGSHLGNVASPHNGEPFPTDPRFQCAVHGVQEVVRMGLDVKAHQVRAEQAMQ